MGNWQESKGVAQPNSSWNCEIESGTEECNNKKKLNLECTFKKLCYSEVVPTVLLFEVLATVKLECWDLFSDGSYLKLLLNVALLAILGLSNKSLKAHYLALLLQK